MFPDVAQIYIEPIDLIIFKLKNSISKITGCLPKVQNLMFRLKNRRIN